MSSLNTASSENIPLVVSFLSLALSAGSSLYLNSKINHVQEGFKPLEEKVENVIQEVKELEKHLATVVKNEDKNNQKTVSVLNALGEMKGEMEKLKRNLDLSLDPRPTPGYQRLTKKSIIADHPPGGSSREENLIDLNMDSYVNPEDLELEQEREMMRDG